MSLTFPVNDFKWVEETSQFNETLIKNIMKIAIWDILSKLMFNIFEKCMNLIMIYRLSLKELKLKKLKKLASNLHDKK